MCRILGKQNFGQVQKIVLSVLCTLKFDTKSTRQPQQYETLDAEQALGMLKNSFSSLGQGVGKALR